MLVCLGKPPSALWMGYSYVIVVDCLADSIGSEWGGGVHSLVQELPCLATRRGLKCHKGCMEMLRTTYR